MNLDNHCGTSNCICTHTYGCEKGWIWRKDTDSKVVTLGNGETKTVTEEREGVYPCPICDPDRHEIFLTSKDSHELFERLRKRGTHQRINSYEQDERSKTRTL